MRAHTHSCGSPGCSYTAINIKDVQAHRRKKHTGSLLSCSTCSKRFADKSNLARHQRSCSQADAELWYCPFCHGSRTARKDNVLRHIRTCSQRGGHDVPEPPRAAAAAIDLLAQAAAPQTAAPELAAPAQVHNVDIVAPATQVAQPVDDIVAAGAPVQQLQPIVDPVPEGFWGIFWSRRAREYVAAGSPGPEMNTNAVFDNAVTEMVLRCRNEASEAQANAPYLQWVAEVDARMRSIVPSDPLVLVRQAALYHFYLFETNQGRL